MSRYALPVPRAAAPVLKAKKHPEAETMSLLLAGTLCVLPFLLPYNDRSEAELLAGALGAAAALAALVVHGASDRILAGPGTLACRVRAVPRLLKHSSLSPVYLQLPLLAALFVRIRRC